MNLSPQKNKKLVQWGIGYRGRYPVIIVVIVVMPVAITCNDVNE